MAKKPVSDVIASETLDPRVYELGFLLSPAVQEDDTQSRVDELKGFITSRGGEILSIGAPEFIDLAYSMTLTVDNKRSHYDQASFGWIKFTLTPDQVTELGEAVAAHREVIRHLLILTVPEQTVVSKRPLGKLLRRPGRAASKDDESSEEELPPVDIAPEEPAVAAEEGVSTDAVEAEAPVTEETPSEETSS
jgi:ribosomal protein S6